MNLCVSFSNHLHVVQVKGSDETVEIVTLLLRLVGPFLTPSRITPVGSVILGGATTGNVRGAQFQVNVATTFDMGSQGPPAPTHN